MAMQKKILISGSTGLIGTALVKRLKELDYAILTLSTSESEGGIHWNPIKQVMGAPIREQLHAVIHLGGAPLRPFWSERMKYDVLESRVNGAKLLSQLILHNPPPECFICVSGVGYYGLPPSTFKAGEGFTETSKPYPFENEARKPFLHEVASQLEEACDPVRSVTRVIHPRLAVILDGEGGALPKMMLPYKLGLGGVLGPPGDQVMPWVSLRDVVNALVFCLEKKDVSGPVNVVSPQTVTQREFAKALGRAMNRPSAIPIPAALLRMVFGREAADSMFLASLKVTPKVLLDKGFEFQDAQLEPLLQRICAQK